MQSDCFPKNYSLKYKKKFHEKRNRNRIASNNFPFDTTQVHKAEVKSRENAKCQHRSSKISMHILHSFFQKCLDTQSFQDFPVGYTMFIADWAVMNPNAVDDPAMAHPTRSGVPALIPTTLIKKF